MTQPSEQTTPRRRLTMTDMKRGFIAQQVEIERLRAAHAENARLLSLVAHDLTGRIEGGKLAAIMQCADRARESANG